MNNKYVYMIVGGLALFLWNYVGNMPYFAEGADWYRVATILALALGAGASEGDDLVAVLVSSIKMAIPATITLSVAYLVSYEVWALSSGAAFDLMALVGVVATAVAATLTTALTMGCLKRSL